jgi:metallophosphoesterase (TIGR00282 family)
MQTIDCPFRAAENALKMISEKTKIIIVDFHADATAEKIAMGWHLDGRVSAIIGTHTHIQTADATILPAGSAYITDVGMTGPYNSVVGMRKDIALKRLLLQTAHKYEMADGDMKIAGVFAEIDSDTGQAMKIESFMFPKFLNSVYEQI